MICAEYIVKVDPSQYINILLTRASHEKSTLSFGRVLEEVKLLPNVDHGAFPEKATHNEKRPCLNGRALRRRI